MITLEIDVPPSTNNLYVNAARGRVKSPAYRRLTSQPAASIQRQVKSQQLKGPWQITIVANIHAARDISNIIKPIEDLMVRLKIVPDDRLCRRVVAARSEGLPVHRASITIKEV